LRLIEAEGDAAAVRKQALALLARREHSGAELREKLAAKGFSADLINTTLSDLDREGWLKDERFVEAFIRTRRERGDGPVKIRAELRERGIGDVLIAAHLDARDPAWQQYLERLWVKRFRAKRPADFAEKGRQMRFFQGRGFTVEQIRAVTERGEGKE
jgi:regulatory protein